LPQLSGLPADKPLATGIRVVRSVSIVVLVMILLVLTTIGLLGLVLHFKEREQVVLPKPTGPYAVGRSLFDWKDPNRTDPYSKSIGKDRELMVWVWYPATPAPGSKPAEYIPSAWASELPWRPMTIPSKVRVHAVPNAPLAGKGKSYPVVVLSTGFGNLPSDYTSLIENLASYGYVVLGITNTYSAPVVRFPDGRVARHLRAASFPRGSRQAIEAAGNRIVKVWAADVHFSLDRLQEMNSNPKSRFYGRLDFTKVGLMGDSLGGAVAAEVCSSDPRCKAGIDINGNLFGSVLKTGIKRPFLFLLSDWTLGPSWVQKTLSGVSLRRIKEHESEIQRQMQEVCRGFAGCWDTHIKGTRHFNFTDVAVLYSPGLEWAGFLGPVDGRAGLASASSCIRTFLDTTLKQPSSTPAIPGKEAGCHYERVGNAALQAP